MLWFSNQTIISFIFFNTLFFTSPVFSINILPNSSLYASNPDQSWKSNSNSFTLHFIPIKDIIFSLCITYYNSIPIWCPVKQTDQNSSFHFLPDGNLRLINGSNAIIWESNTTHLNISHATLEESGNFVLENTSSGSLWSSFEHATDTLVPTQELSVRSVLTSAYYSFKFDNNGTLKLTWNNSINYWSFGLNSSSVGNLSDPSLSLQRSGVLSLYDHSLSNPLNLAYSSDFGEGDDFRFLKLDMLKLVMPTRSLSGF